jgi:hypothetical protein
MSALLSRSAQADADAERLHVFFFARSTAIESVRVVTEPQWLALSGLMRQISSVQDVDDLKLEIIALADAFGVPRLGALSQ